MFRNFFPRNGLYAIREGCLYDSKKLKNTRMKYHKCILTYISLQKASRQGESAHTLVLTVKMHKLEIVYLWKIDTKVGSKSTKLD
jgi:hypothetical protein